MQNKQEKQPTKKSNVVLIGMPGVGKSTAGIVLAKILNLRFIDADLLIQNECDKTLQKIIDALGPEGFIEIENQILSNIQAESTLISTGGSAIYSDEAMAHLKDIGTVVYLETSFVDLRNRLHDFQERGVVQRDGSGKGVNLRDLYDERIPLYEQYADITVNIEDLTIPAAARKIVAALERENKI